MVSEMGWRLQLASDEQIKVVSALSDVNKPAGCGIIGNGAVQTGKSTKTTEKAVSKCFSFLYSITYSLALS